ncbi:DUF374 domain-containing protein [Helicobacter saguini]|uniref:DUF374 domain-containing protein n=1 Tax=Helicobacter saguini TaxID=1548018 RepID=A0A347VPA7_9HELI|nr:lysophospholipid acyltransferase family protein [Helicobacter saguini]MWV61442.1 DUF374 domain-containing protein [Helicobacter saguini]MWV67887.1 DUF374 domain-containing protein [Helicobacter saguini]MWV70644.1 DUF374 domain-containing protein [Helicobacter saguini]MWV72549.1 DUF374 domain-containing protein [Helicobacter saguini]TLD94714.1 DUF374 domain-containing protein [Helicobacter saguini]
MGSIFDKFMNRDKQKQLRVKYGDIFMRFLASLAYFTCRNRYHICDYVREKPFIACLWHGNFLMMPYLYAKVRNPPKMSLVTSAHEDGVMVERYFAHFGLKSIRGSTSVRKGGARALMQAIRELRDGRDIAVTPDGPKGPAKSIANGILLMSLKSGVAICGCRVKPSRFWQLRTWDKFCIPKPFSRIDYYIAEPLMLDSNMDIDVAKRLLSEYMERLDSI